MAHAHARRQPITFHLPHPGMHYPGANTGGQQTPLSTGANQIHQTNCIPTVSNAYHIKQNTAINIQQRKRNIICSQQSSSIVTTVYLLLHKTFMQLHTRSCPTLSPFLSMLWIDILQERSHCSLQFSPLVGEHKCTPGYLWHHHGDFFIATLLPPWLLVQQSLSQLHDTPVATVALLQHCLLRATKHVRNLHSHFPPSWAGISTKQQHRAT